MEVWQYHQELKNLSHAPVLYYDKDPGLVKQLLLLKKEFY